MSRLSPNGPVSFLRAGRWRHGTRVAWGGATDGVLERMRAQFGEGYAESVAKDYVLSDLGGRTINKALADGEDAKVVWRAVCETFSVSDSLR